MEIARLAFTKERQAAIESGMPAGKAAEPHLVGEEVAIGKIQFGDVEVEQRASKGDDVPEEGDDGRRPDAQRDDIAEAPSLLGRPPRRRFGRLHSRHDIPRPLPTSDG